MRLEVDGAPRELALGTVTKALVQVELNRPYRKVGTSEGEEA